MDLDFDVLKSPAFVILYGMVFVSIWIIPKVMNFEGLSLPMKIIGSIVLLPVVFLILSKMNEG